MTTRRPRPPGTRCSRGRARLCPWGHLRSRAARRPKRCSTRPSDRTWPGPSPSTATAKRSCRAIRASGGPIASSPNGWRRSPAVCSSAGLQPGDRVGIWSPNYAEWTLVQYATAEIGVILVNINPAYRTPRARLRAPALGMPDADRRAELQDVRLPGDRRRGSCRLPGARDRPCSSGTPSGTNWPAAGRRPIAELDDRRATPGGRRPDQHPVHVGHHRLPEGRHPLAPQHPQQRPLRRRAAGLHERRPALHPRALLPLLRHGDGQPRLHDARRHDGDPERRVRPADRARRGREGALHRPLRRADDVHRRTRSRAFRASSTCRACAPA